MFNGETPTRNGHNKTNKRAPFKQPALEVEEIIYPNRIDQVIAELKNNKNLTLKKDRRDIAFKGEKFVFDSAYMCSGKNKFKNQDCVFMNAAKGYGIVCDGVGGALYSEKASQTAVKLLSEELDKVVFTAKPEVVERHIKNMIITKVAPEISIGATTLAAFKIVFDKEKQPYLVSFSIGDSQIYVNRPGNLDLIKINKDQTALTEFFDDLGKILTEGLDRYPVLLNYYKTMGIDSEMMRAFIKKLKTDYDNYARFEATRKNPDFKKDALRAVREDLNDLIDSYYEKKRPEVELTEKEKEKIKLEPEILSREKLASVFFPIYWNLNLFLLKDLKEDRKLKSKDIDSQIFKLKPGDVIIVCSDGISDNLSPQKIKTLAVGDPAKAVVKITKETQTISDAPKHEALACSKPDDKAIGLMKIKG
jgi:serine/threonine protein phosphatase PrpC